MRGVASLLRGPRSAVWLLVVAVWFVGAQFAWAAGRVDLGWDESVYASQVDPRIPAAFFSAPRARGISLLVAPLVEVTGSHTALRVYLVLLGAAGLVISFWPWLRLVGGVTVGLAALLFTGLWVVQFYGSEAMPNLYVAYGSVAAVGWFVRAWAGGARRAYAGVAVSLCLVGLLRPADAGFLVVGLLVVALATRRWALLVVAVGGVAAGVVPWVVEAYARFGGPLQRLHQSSVVEGGMGLHVAAGMELRALNGPILCRPCTSTLQVAPTSVWWPALPILAVAGLLIAARSQRRPLGLAAVCGGAMAIQYMFLIGYSAPRFLIPAYALLSLPIAALAVGLVRHARGALRPVAITAVALVIAVQLVAQHRPLTSNVNASGTTRLEYPWLTAELRHLGVHRPCTLTGDEAQPLAYYAGCGSTDTTEPPDPGAVNFALVEHVAPRPAFADSWRRYAVDTAGGRHWRIYLPPPVSRSDPRMTSMRSIAPPAA